MKDQDHYIIKWFSIMMIVLIICISAIEIAKADDDTRLRTLTSMHNVVIAFHVKPNRELWDRYGRNQYATDYSDKVIHRAWWVGDCSEYAMTMRGYLEKRLGYQRDEFEMYTCKTSKGVPHRVLKVRDLYTDIMEGPQRTNLYFDCVLID